MRNMNKILRGNGKSPEFPALQGGAIHSQKGVLHD